MESLKRQWAVLVVVDSEKLPKTAQKVFFLLQDKCIAVVVKEMQFYNN